MRYLVFLFVLCLAAGDAEPARAAEPPPTDPAEAAYRKARTCYYDLKKAPAQQKQREAWEGCIRRFLEVERDFRTSLRAAEAAYSAGRLYEELFSASKNPADLRLAIQQYEEVAKHYKKHRLADDALYRIGIVHWEGLQAQRKGKAAMWRVVRWYPEGDMAFEAKKFLRGKSRPTGALLELQHPAVTVPSAPQRESAPIIEKTLTEEGAPATPPAPKTSPTSQAPAARPLRIVIDPGHGGKDTGAIGPGGSQEKQVTLAIAKRLAAALPKRFPCEVALTRQSDIYLTLEQRNAIANRRAADLFISIHANASVSKAQRGIQTYYLNNASDEASRRLADRENRMAGKSVPELQAIISTMLQNAVTDESRSLARTVHRRLVGGLKQRYAAINDQGVRTALFYVLVGAKSPSVLVETSYLSHPEEERRLKDPNYQTHVAGAIAAGVAEFVAARPAMANL